MTQAAPSEQAAQTALPAPADESGQRDWPARALASALALLTAALVVALAIWTSVVPLLAALLRNPGETPSTMASIAFASAWGLSGLGAVGGWLATAVQALRGRTGAPHRIAVVLTVGFLLLGFSLAAAWPEVAPWLAQALPGGNGTALNLDLFGLGSLVVAGAQSATAIALGVTPRRLATALLPVLAIGVPATFASTGVIVAGGGRTFPPARLIAASLTGDGMLTWVALATLAALACFLVAAALAHRRRHEPGRLWVRIAAVLALVVILLTGAFLVVTNQLYQASTGTAGWPGTPYLPISLSGWLVTALAVAILVLPGRGRQPAPELPPSGSQS
ncbi:hypothetical protein [Micropruina sp.]|uniref:hypothetical protein n=1 Tax=Micropruina sp. TaxID=2737536 RepID=UPI002624A4C3|nr:hypothetical protein [Micropruina sp.]